MAFGNNKTVVQEIKNVLSFFILLSLVRAYEKIKKYFKRLDNIFEAVKNMFF